MLPTRPREVPLRTRRLTLLVALLIAFLVISGFALADRSYLELWRLPFSDSGTLQLFADLTVAMLLVTSWMFRDSRTSGVPALPYVLLTVAAGSLGPLGYLIHRELRAPKRGPS